MQATLAGDRGAFDELLGRYEGRIYNLALRVTGNVEDAMDATQSAFLKAYDNLDRYKPAHRFFSWIYRIGLNEAINIVNSRRRYVGLEGDPARGDADPERLSTSREAGREIAAALEGLTPEYRTAVVLRHLHGLSYREMSRVTGVPVKTVKSRLFSARQRLRLILSGRGLER